MSPKERAPLHLPQGDVRPVEGTKYKSGGSLDRHGVSRPPTPDAYTSVLRLPRCLYAADVWCNPAAGNPTGHINNAKITKLLTTIQRAGALAITGGLKRSPTDLIDAAAYSNVLYTTSVCSSSLSSRSWAAISAIVCRASPAFALPPIGTLNFPEDSHILLQ